MKISVKVYKTAALAVLASFSLQMSQPQVAQAQGDPALGDQLISDLLTAGVSVTSAVIGSVPLALASGYITKYISVYGTQGIKALSRLIAGHPPQDLGEINLYYIYLLNTKRNLYSTLIQVRKSAEKRPDSSVLMNQIQNVENTLRAECESEAGCIPTALDDKLINYQFLNIALDAKSSIDVGRMLSDRELKNTYQYLMLLYLDVIITEQKLLEAQYNVLAARTMSILKDLRNNPYISKEEKEYQAQLVINMALRMEVMSDQRRVILANTLAKPLAALQAENSQLDTLIDEFRSLESKKRRRN